MAQNSYPNTFISFPQQEQQQQPQQQQQQLTSSQQELYAIEQQRRANKMMNQFQNMPFPQQQQQIPQEQKEPIRGISNSVDAMSQQNQYRQPIQSPPPPQQQQQYYANVINNMQQNPVQQMHDQGALSNNYGYPQQSPLLRQNLINQTNSVQTQQQQQLPQQQQQPLGASTQQVRTPAANKFDNVADLKMVTIPPSNEKIYIVKNHILGEGSFANTYVAMQKGEQKIYACKIIQKQQLIQKLMQAQNPQEKQEFFLRALFNEVQVWMKLDHPNIVKFYDYSETPNNYYFIMEYCEGGDLETIKKQFHRVEEKNAIILFHQLIEGCKYLYDKSVFHRDLKPANVLISGGTAKIADFGFCKLVEQNKEKAMLQTTVGTPFYMSPQILKSAEYSIKCDVWSLGIMFYEILTGTLPWLVPTKSSTTELLDKILNEPLEFPKSLTLTNDIKHLISMMLQIQEEERISMPEALVQIKHILKLHYPDSFRNHPVTPPSHNKIPNSYNNNNNNSINNNQYLPYYQQSQGQINPEPAFEQNQGYQQLPLQQQQNLEQQQQLSQQYAQKQQKLQQQQQFQQMQQQNQQNSKQQQQQQQQILYQQQQQIQQQQQQQMQPQQIPPNSLLNQQQQQKAHFARQESLGFEQGQGYAPGTMYPHQFSSVNRDDMEGQLQSHEIMQSMSEGDLNHHIKKQNSFNAQQQQQQQLQQNQLFPHLPNDYDNNPPISNQSFYNLPSSQNAFDQTGYMHVQNGYYSPQVVPQSAQQGYGSMRPSSVADLWQTEGIKEEHGSLAQIDFEETYQQNLQDMSSNQVQMQQLGMNHMPQMQAAPNRVPNQSNNALQQQQQQQQQQYQFNSMR